MAPITMHRNDWVAIGLIVGATICSIAMIVFGANGCASSAEKRINYTVEETQHSKASIDCIQVAKRDSGTMAEFCDCWTKVQAEHHVDAGECR